MLILLRRRNGLRELHEIRKAQHVLELVAFLGRQRGNAQFLDQFVRGTFQGRYCKAFLDVAAKDIGQPGVLAFVVPLFPDPLFFQAPHGAQCPFVKRDRRGLYDRGSGLLFPAK